MTRTQILGTIAALFLGGLVMAAQSTRAQQQPDSITTRSGFNVERVTVQGACVVIVSRVSRSAGDGAGDYLAAVPCG
jgi:hypothetical protein